MSENTFNPLIFSPFDVDSDNPSSDWEGFKAIYDDLPARLQDFLFDISTAYSVQELSERNNLSEEQSRGLTRTIRDVAVASSYLGDTPVILIERLDVAPGVATDIANQLVPQFFAPVIGEVLEVQKQNFGNKVLELGINPQQVAIEQQPLPPPPPPTPSRPPQLPTTPPSRSSQPAPPANPSFHEQNMSQKDIMEVGGNVLDLRN